MNVKTRVAKDFLLENFDGKVVDFVFDEERLITHRFVLRVVKFREEGMLKRFCCCDAFLGVESE